LTAYYFFTSLADVFLVVMVWLVLENERPPAVFIDNNKVYAVVDVIKESNSSL
jgi:hypothetical protein